MVLIKQIGSPQLIEDACALLYEVLVNQAKWNFSPNNPSQLRVEVKNGRRLLKDRFTESAVWFGAFDGSRIIGCIRLTFMDENKKLEMESYPNSHVIQKYLPIDRSSCLELTRAAVLRDRQSLMVRISDLILATFNFCQKNQYSICTASHNNHMKNLYKKVGYPLKMEQAFKYEEHDPAPVNFYFADYNKSEVKMMISELEDKVRYVKV